MKELDGIRKIYGGKLEVLVQGRGDVGGRSVREVQARQVGESYERLGIRPVVVIDQD